MRSIVADAPGTAGAGSGAAAAAPQDAAPLRLQDGGEPVADRQLPVDVLAVLPHGPDRAAEPVRDGAGGEALGEADQHAELTSGDPGLPGPGLGIDGPVGVAPPARDQAGPSVQRPQQRLDGGHDAQLAVVVVPPCPGEREGADLGRVP